MGADTFAVSLLGHFRDRALQSAEILRAAPQALQRDDQGESIPVAARFGVTALRKRDANADAQVARGLTAHRQAD